MFLFWEVCFLSDLLRNYWYTQKYRTVELSWVIELSEQSADKGKATAHIKKEKQKFLTNNMNWQTGILQPS